MASNSVARSAHDIPLVIQLQEALRFCGPDKAGRFITKGLAVILFKRLPVQLYPDTAARETFRDEIQRQAEQLDALLLTLVYGSPVLAGVLDRIILEQAALMGQRITYSKVVSGRVAIWRKQDFSLFQDFNKAVLLGEKRCRGDRPFPLTDPGLRFQVRTLCEELTTLKKLLRRRAVAVRELEHQQLLCWFFELSVSGACPHVAASVDKWIEFLDQKAHRDQLRAMAMHGRVRVRDIVLTYIGHYTGHKLSYVERSLRKR
jgi:hypothetical protein